MVRVRLVVALVVLGVVFGARTPVHAATPYGATPRPVSCQSTDRPETGLQGEVSRADRDSGRSALGYSCNLSLVGQLQGQGSSWISQQYGHCAYVGQSLVGNLIGAQRGVRVIDLTDPATPRQTAMLTSPAMAGDTWESLRVNQSRGLLAAVAVGPALGVAFFDVYDVKTDCAHPRLLNSVAGTQLSIPANVIGHEGGFSPDGHTYWASGVAAGSLTAIDVTDPAAPRLVWTGVTGSGGHGFGISADGNRMYLTTLSGFTTFDISEVQHRVPLARVRPIGSSTWDGTVAPQHTISITYRGAPWIIAVDEIGRDGIHFIDNTNAAHAVVHPGISLEIERPANDDRVKAEAGDDVLGLFGYGPHYCAVDRVIEPTALACGYFQSGVRVFDIRDLAAPKEVAYFNPPAQTAKKNDLPASWHSSLGDLTADWCTSPPAFVGDELRVACQDNGYMTLAFAPGTYPFATETASAPSVPVSTPRAGPVLPATGGDFSFLFWSLGAFGVVVAVRGARRFGAPRLMAVALVVGLMGSVSIDQHRGEATRFAMDMIAHHQEAIAMSRVMEADPRAAAGSRRLARQIDVAQTREVRLLERWLHANGDAVPDHRDHAAHAAAQLTQSAAPIDATFLRTMQAHHRSGLAIADAARGNRDVAISVMATSMLVDQSIEIAHIDRVLGRGAQPALAYVCDLS